MGKNKISISVAGSEFVVTTDENREYTLELARTVDTKIRSLLENTKLTVGLAAILACLDLCDENEKNKQSCARLREEIRRGKKVDKLVAKVTADVPEPTDDEAEAFFEAHKAEFGKEILPLG